MRQVISNKRVEYTLFLKKQLSKNADRIQTEKVAVNKFNKSIKGMQETFKQELEKQLDIIQKKEEASKQKGKDTEESISEEIESLKVDSYQIQAITTMLDDFENIIGKNFC